MLTGAPDILDILVPSILDTMVASHQAIGYGGGYSGANYSGANLGYSGLTSGYSTGGRWWPFPGGYGLDSPLAILVLVLLVGSALGYSYPVTSGVSHQGSYFGGNFGNYSAAPMHVTGQIYPVTQYVQAEQSLFVGSKVGWIFGLGSVCKDHRRLSTSLRLNTLKPLFCLEGVSFQCKFNSASLRINSSKAMNEAPSGSVH